MVEEPVSAGTTRRGQLTFFPVVPGSVPFALRLRRYLLAMRPKVVAVELPSALEEHFRRAIDRMPRMSTILVPEASEDDRASYFIVEPADAFIEALRTALEIGAEIVFLAPDEPLQRKSLTRYPDPHAVDIVGLQSYVNAFEAARRDTEASTNVQGIAWKLQGLDLSAESAVVLSLDLLYAVLAAFDVPQDEPRRRGTYAEADLFNLHPDCLAEVSSEIPYFQAAYESIRSDASLSSFDRPRCQLALLQDAEKEYVINTGDRIRSWQRLALAKFSRNLALLDGALTPGAYDLTLAARSIVDDNFAYEVWQMANRYPEQQTEDPPLETLNLSGEELWLHTRKIRIRRRLPRLKQRLKPARLKGRPREKFKGQWAREVHGGSICSYPPEDLVIENYGRVLKQKAKAGILEERSRVEPFLTSIRDGIDIRETIRKWHEGKLYVRDLAKDGGEVGALIVIFDEDRADRYTYLTTWQGEHQNESDMAFYSTPPFDHMVGPGIGRGEYGGLLMTLPPRRLYDVWNDLDYETAETKAERLLMAGLDYSMERHVVYVAARPPRSIFRRMANTMNRNIVYIPIGQLPPDKLKKIRVVHVLDNYARRLEAGKYIW